MRSNVLQTLLVAFILIVGWTLFTIYQDLTSKPGGLNHRTIIQHSRQYLPLMPGVDSPSTTKSLPVYKPAAGSDIANKRTSSRNSGSLFSSSAFDISQPSAIGGGVLQDQHSMGNSGRSNADKASSVYPTITFQPFSRRAGGGVTALLDRNTETNQAGGASASLFGEETRYKALGPNDDDPFEQGGGNENLDAYNDVPVGEGIFFLILLLVLYTALLFKRKKLIRND